MQEFKDHIIVTHSRQTESERHLGSWNSSTIIAPIFLIGKNNAERGPIIILGVLLSNAFFHER